MDDQTDYLAAIARHLNWRNRHQSAQQLAPVLNLSVNSVLDRLNGKTKLTYAEVVQIGAHFHVYPRDFVQGVYATEKKVYGTMQHSEEVSREVNGCRTSGDRLCYAATEIPVFYTLGFPTLASIKAHVWQNFEEARRTRRLPPFAVEPYRAAGLTERFRAVYEDYQHIPRQEIWSINMFDNPLSQIRYLVEMGALETDSATFSTLENEVTELLDQLEEMAYNDEHPLVVYPNRFHYASNFILRRGEVNRVAYVPGKNLSFYRYAAGQTYYNFADDWDTQLSFLLPLPEMDHRETVRFFRALRKRVRRELQDIVDF